MAASPGHLLLLRPPSSSSALLGAHTRTGGVKSGKIVQERNIQSSQQAIHGPYKYSWPRFQEGVEGCSTSPQQQKPPPSPPGRAGSIKNIHMLGFLLPLPTCFLPGKKYPCQKDILLLMHFGLIPMFQIEFFIPFRSAPSASSPARPWPPARRRRERGTSWRRWRRWRRPCSRRTRSARP